MVSIEKVADVGRVAVQTSGDGADRALVARQRDDPVILVARVPLLSTLPQPLERRAALGVERPISKTRDFGIAADCEQRVGVGELRPPQPQTRKLKRVRRHHQRQITCWNSSSTLPRHGFERRA